VVTLATSEGAALGAAIQAVYARENEGAQEERVSYESLCARLVHLDEGTRCRPQPEAAAFYQKQLVRQMELTGRLQQTGWL
jgi:xylulokinase